MRDHKSRMNFIPALLEQVLDNKDQIAWYLMQSPLNQSTS